MTIFERIKNSMQDDKGSTLITVIVAIGFVTILTTVILGASLTNFRMKAIDRRAKDDFYYTEKAVNDIYTGIGQKVAVIAADAYDAAFSSVGVSVKDVDRGSVDVSTSQKAEKYYKRKFYTDLKNWLDANANDAEFQKFIVNDKDATGKEAYVMDVGSVVAENIVEEAVTDLDAHPEKYETDVSSIRIKGINVVCADTNKDYKGEVITDIVITVPMMGFFDNNADVVDYAIIANKGIEVDGDVTVVDGNVYAGLTKVSGAVSGGININKGKLEFDGNYLVSKGDITVGKSGATSPAIFKAGYNRPSRPNIWFDSIVTPESATTPSIDINANTFALNDIELNAHGSNAKFSGSFYGYDEGFLDSSTDDDTKIGMLIDNGKKHSDSSAIIINGDRCTLNMKGLSTLMLMGKAYIETPDGSEISTAEAMALRTNQQLYLVPPDFLSCANPAAGTKTESDWGCNIPDTWFGYEYLKINSSTGKPEIQTVCVGSGESAVSYAFLMFDETRDYDLSSSSSFRRLGGSAHNKARSAFIYEIIHGNDSASPSVQPSQDQLKERISNSLANYDSFRLQECVVNNSSTANIYSVNAIASYVVVDPDEGVNGYSGINLTNRIGAVDRIVAVSNTAAMDRYLGYPQNLFRRYQWLCTMLIPNEDIPLSKPVPAVPHIDPLNAADTRGVRKIGEDVAWKADSDYPYIYYVKDSSSWPTPEPSDDTKNLASSIYGEFKYQNGCTIPDNANFRGVIISTGDITVGRNASIDGCLIAKGKISFLGNNTVKSDKAIIQKRIAKELEINKEYGYYSNFLISYLDNGAGSLLYGVSTPAAVSKEELEERTNYTEYIFFENWKKGGRSD